MYCNGHTLVAWALLLGNAAAGIPFRRADEGSSVSPASAASTVAGSQSATAISESVATASGETAKSGSLAPTASVTGLSKSLESAAATSSNATVTKSSTASSASVTSLANDKLNSTNDPNECHKTSDTGAEGVTNAICTPAEGQKLNYSKSFDVTWDVGIFPVDGKVTIELFYAIELNSSQHSNTSIGEPNAQSIFSQQTEAALGHLVINMTEPMLNGKSSNNLTLFLHLDDTTTPKQYPGPTFNLTSDKSSSSSSSSGSSSTSKKVGEKVGIPIGTIFFLAIVAVGAFFLFRRYRSRQGGNGGAGYLGGKSFSERTSTGTMGAGGAAGVGSSRHTRHDSFHDEPTRGMELQPRTSGVSSFTQRPGEDGTWDWRDSVSGPNSPTGGGDGGGNVFRDELHRQKTIGRAS